MKHLKKSWTIWNILWNSWKFLEKSFLDLSCLETSWNVLWLSCCLDSCLFCRLFDCHSVCICLFGCLFCCLFGCLAFWLSGSLVVWLSVLKIFIVHTNLVFVHTVKIMGFKMCEFLYLLPYGSFSCSCS